MSRPRIVDNAQLAKHLGYDAPSTAMTSWVRETLGVSPLPGRRGRWDLNAIDAALNRLSKLSSRGDASDPYEAWKRNDEAA